MLVGFSGFGNLHKNLNKFSKQTREICFIKPKRDYVCYLNIIRYFFQHISVLVCLCVCLYLKQIIYSLNNEMNIKALAKKVKYKT